MLSTFYNKILDGKYWHSVHNKALERQGEDCINFSGHTSRVYEGIDFRTSLTQFKSLLYVCDPQSSEEMDEYHASRNRNQVSKYE